LPKTFGKNLYLLNLKELTPVTSTGSSPCKMAENYRCAGIILNKICNYFENIYNYANWFVHLKVRE
jgi:hypothetical protein